MTATLERYMTRHPHTIRYDEKLSTAAALMASLNVRHLPVLEGGELRGVMSDRDLRLAKGRDLSTIKVMDVCVDEPYAIDVDTSLFLVAQHMAERHIGSALVLEEGKVVGIFTATDACRALADALRP